LNWRLIGYVLGSLCLISAAAMVPSLCIALIGEETFDIQLRMAVVFGVVIALSVFAGVALRRTLREHRHDRITPSDGFAVAAFGWVLMAVIGALPYLLSRSGVPFTPDAPGTTPGTNLGFVDALFESMSGFTTTGSTVFGTALQSGGLGLIESMPASLLFWRSMTHWLGGMGIVVLVLSILPALRAGGYQLFQAEVPGPTAERLMPRIRRTAAILWGVYLLLTVAETALLYGGGMPILDALCHTFGTMATGGFSPKDASVGHYAQVGHPHALYFETVICVFMFLAGCNFLLHYMALRGRLLSYWRNAEFRQYVRLLAAAVVVLTLLTWIGKYSTIGEAFRKSVFHTLSITTTTGFVTDNFSAWPGACLILLLALMFCGGCAGSTGGGLKQIRVMVVFKYVYRELLKLLRPNLVKRIRIGETTMEERTCSSIIGLVLLWMLVFVIATFGLLLVGGEADADDDADQDERIVTSLSAVAATLNNIGPGLGKVGAPSNYGWMSAPAKIILLLCMLMGRLEVYAVIVVLLPLAWRK
jgi:trk system potassium uptake protein TrkH